MEDPPKQVSVWGKDGSLATWNFTIVNRRGSGSYEALHMEKKTSTSGVKGRGNFGIDVVFDTDGSFTFIL